MAHKREGSPFSLEFTHLRYNSRWVNLKYNLAVVRKMRRTRLSIIILAIAALVIGLFSLRSYKKSLEEHSKLPSPMGQMHKQEQMRGTSPEGRGTTERRIKARDKQEEIYKVPQPIKLDE